MNYRFLLVCLLPLVVSRTFQSCTQTVMSSLVSFTISRVRETSSITVNMAKSGRKNKKAGKAKSPSPTVSKESVALAKNQMSFLAEERLDDATVASWMVSSKTIV